MAKSIPTSEQVAEKPSFSLRIGTTRVAAPTSNAKQSCRILTQNRAVPLKSFCVCKQNLAETFPISCTQKMRFHQAFFFGTLRAMDIVLSHITALRYWLSRPSTAPRLRHDHAKLPASSTPKAAIGQLQHIARPPFHVLCSTPIKGGALHGVSHHTWRTPLPPDVVFRISPSVRVCSPELAFLQVAQSLETANLVRLGFELCGCYSLDSNADGGFFGRAPLTTPERLQLLCDQLAAVRGIRNAKVALPHILANSASPAETRIAMALSLPHRHGGLGLPAPCMNQRIQLSANEQKLLRKRYFSCDLYWPDRKLAVEYDSDAHHTGAEKIATDAARRNSLQYADVKVITISSRTYRDVDEFNATGRIIAKHLGKEIRPRCQHFTEKQSCLRRTLASPPPWL